MSFNFCYAMHVWSSEFLCQSFSSYNCLVCSELICWNYCLQTAARQNNVSVDSLSWEFLVTTTDDSMLLGIGPPKVCTACQLVNHFTNFKLSMHAEYSIFATVAKLPAYLINFLNIWFIFPRDFCYRMEYISRVCSWKGLDGTRKTAVW